MCLDQNKLNRLLFEACLHTYDGWKLGSNVSHVCLQHKIIYHIVCEIRTLL